MFCLCNFKTVKDISTKLGTNINHLQTFAGNSYIFHGFILLCDFKLSVVSTHATFQYGDLVPTITLKLSKVLL